MPLLLPPPEDRFWGSGESRGARFFLFGAPLDLTGSGRLGTGKAPPAVRRASHNIESYSPKLDGDLFEAGLTDLGDLELAGLPMEAALAEIERQTAEILHGSATPCALSYQVPSPNPSREGGRRGGVPIVVGGEHTIALAIGRAVKKRYPGRRHHLAGRPPGPGRRAGRPEGGARHLGLPAGRGAGRLVGLRAARDALRHARRVAALEGAASGSRRT